LSHPNTKHRSAVCESDSSRQTVISYIRLKNEWNNMSQGNDKHLVKTLCGIYSQEPLHITDMSVTRTPLYLLYRRRVLCVVLNIRKLALTSLWFHFHACQV
jgi:hypothetical protein